MKLERLVISCGGTGGHFNPGLSVAREFQEHGGKVLLILGGKNAAKHALIAKNAGIESVTIDARPVSKNPFRAMLFLYSTFHGLNQSARILREFKPQALLAMGSYTSLTPVISAWVKKIPVFLHDGNARLGKANRILSHFAKAIALSFPAEDAKLCKCPSILTGMPLRQEIVRGIMPREQAIAEINTRWVETFSPEKPVVLVFGGSLGANTINLKARPLETMQGIGELQIIRLVGPGKLEEVRPLYEKSKAHVMLLEACQDMNILYSAADLVISRAGGSTVSELAVYGKYALLLPYPFAAANHQDYNARYLVSAGGAQIMPDYACTPESTTEFLSAWLANREEFRRRGEKSRTLARPDASANVIAMIENILSASEKQK